MSKEDTQTGGLCFLAKKAEANTPQLIGFLLVVLDAPQRQPLRCGGWSAGGLFLVDTGCWDPAEEEEGPLVMCPCGCSFAVVVLLVKRVTTSLFWLSSSSSILRPAAQQKVLSLCAPAVGVVLQLYCWWSDVTTSLFWLAACSHFPFPSGVDMCTSRLAPP
jgi:hypothetical protein